MDMLLDGRFKHVASEGALKLAGWKNGDCVSPGELEVAL
jgi:hypothetical protein